MDRKLKVYYADLPNMGDQLNVLILNKVFGCNIKRRTYLTCELSAIGSGLGNFMKSPNPKMKMAQTLCSPFGGGVAIWGTGFLSEGKNDTAFFRKNMNFCAVRGELSRQRVERILHQKLDIPTGDAGLLANLLVNQKEKRYAVGVIPHFREQDEPIFQTIKNRFSNSILIDLREDPMEVIETISQCEFIISSSLHGLIVADSFGIPNVHIVVSNKLKGDGFKFKDYYSSFGLDHHPINLNVTDIPSLDQIAEMYQIKQAAVQDKIEKLINAFPFK